MNNKCSLCGCDKLTKREGKCRDNDSLEILECNNCGLVFLSSFEHIDSNFYEDAKMHENETCIDIEKWLKITEKDDEKRFLEYEEAIKGKTILDFGCGCGGFLIRAKKSTKECYGIELEKRLKPYFEKEGLNVFSDIRDIPEKVDSIFMFHVLEHIENPIPLLESFKTVLKPNGKLIVEVPNSDDALLTLYKNKAFSEFTYWSPHLYLYNEKTLEMLLSKINYNKIDITQKQRYPLANHLYWLSNNKPGGGEIWNFLDKKELNIQYEKALAELKKCDTILGTFAL